MGRLNTRNEHRELNWPNSAVPGPGATIVSDNALADKAGIEILKKGGNAVDAAVAVAFALAVVEPRAGNIGGGGFMLVRLADGRTIFVDYREEAPAKATREMYRKADGTYDSDASRTGYRAVGVPGTVAGMALALRLSADETCGRNGPRNSPRCGRLHDQRKTSHVAARCHTTPSAI